MAQELFVRDVSPSYALHIASPLLAAADTPADCRRVSVYAVLACLLRRLHDRLRCGTASQMPCTCLRFSTQRLPSAKFVELDRQLAGQQAGLNALTVAEYLQARAGFSPAGRDPQVARRARASWRSKLVQARSEALTHAGCGEADATVQAQFHADRQMRSLHALHNPDRIAGGHDVIADFGDGQVNSTIGRQWNLMRGRLPSRVQQLDAAASSVPEAVRAETHMNGMLVRDT